MYIYIFYTLDIFYSSKISNGLFSKLKLHQSKLKPMTWIPILKKTQVHVNFITNLSYFFPFNF